MTAAPTDLDPPCPPAPAAEAGAAEPARRVPRRSRARLRRRPPPVRHHRAGHLGRPRRRLAVGHPVRPLGRPPRLVGRLRRERPRADAGRRGSRRRRPGGARSPSSRSCTATRWSPTTRSSGRASAATRTCRSRAVAPTAKAVFFGASYHVDYATLLARPADLPAVAEAVAEALATPAATPTTRTTRRPGTWWTCAASAAATRPPTRWPRRSAPGPARAGRWSASARRSAPSSPSSPGADFEAYLGTLGKKERHEVRRKLRRAEAAGAVRLERSTDPVADLDAFVDLHQKRWGAEGLFPPTPGGDQSRAFFRRLFELLGDDGTVQLHFLAVGGRRIAAGVWFEDADAWYLYNAGVDPEARELSPGVLMSAHGDPGRHRSPAGGASTTSAATSRTSTSGAPSTSQSSASSSCERGTRDGCPAARRSLRQAEGPAPGPRRTARARRGAAGDRDERRRPGARLLAPLAPGPRPLRADASSRSRTAAPSARSPAWGSRST